MHSPNLSTSSWLALTSLLSVTLACNVVDPEADADAGQWIIVEDDAGDRLDASPRRGDTGPSTEDAGEDTGTDAEADAEADADTAPDLGDCPGGAARNECGGCEVLDARVGETCPGFECGALACIGEDELGCDCLQRDGCGVNAEQTACVCQPFYEPDGSVTCADIDECTRDICDPETTCTNLVGGFECSECPEGAIDVNDDGTRCEAPLEAIEVVVLSGTHPGNTSACLEVTCPAGKVAISGGPDNDPAIDIDASRRSNNGASWLICGFSPTQAVWDVVATCARANVPVTEVQNLRVLAPGESACFAAACPSGQRAIGGGGSWGGGFQMDHNRPELDGSGWAFCGLDDGDGSDPRVVAICADVPTRVRANQLPSGVFGDGCIEQGCEPGEALVGGGAFWGFDRTRTRNAPVVPAKDQWQLCGAEARNQGDAWVVSVCVDSP